jgi:hypothetical protein|tara:strand:+ start:1468 stop:1584 length:117 start_codon:yes stop_codon:yes gene_type:complete
MEIIDLTDQDPDNHNWLNQVRQGKNEQGESNPDELVEE